MLGYLTSAVVYGLLLTASLTLWRRRLTGSGIAAALCAQVGWSIVLAARGSSVPGELQIGAEYVRDLAWALVLTRCLRASSDQRAARSARRVLLGLVAIAIVGIAVRVAPGVSAALRDLGPYRLWASFTLSIAGLVLVEQVARNTRSAHRWSLKLIWLAIGALYACDLYVYSMLMLRGGEAPQSWTARGFVNALLGGLLAIGLRRITGWTSAAFLSPRVIFFNATLLGAAFYVLIMAAGSYFVRDLGGTWGAAGQLVFLAAGGLVLAVAVLSEQFRAWARVIVAKHLFPYRYDYRSEWRKLTRALSVSGGTPVHERIAVVMAGFVSSPAGGLWLRDAEGAYTPAGGELAPPDAPREKEHRAFFEHLIEHEWIYDLEEARKALGAGAARASRRRNAAPSAPRWMLEDPKLWLIVPLICEETLVGFVAVGQPLAATGLGWEEIDLLRSAGRQAASFLAFEQTAKRLAETQQFEAMSRLTAFLMHDLRHLIAQQALVVENAARHRGNPEFFDDAMLTIESSVRRMTRLMEELRSGVLTEQSQRVELAELCAEAVRRSNGRQPVPGLDAHDRGVEVVVNRERLLRVLEHVIRNAQEATPANGTVTIRLRRPAAGVSIEVVDTGAGMDPDFIRNRLFRPFETTKGGSGFGIGAYEAREFVRRCGGDVAVESTLGGGTTFAIHLPLAPVLGPVEDVRPHELEAH